MNLTFLGTGGGLPSPQRGVSAIALQYGRDILLFDCGEGTQRQFMTASLSFMKISSIFITHLHGVPGLIQSMNLSGRTEPLSIFGPSGTVDLIKSSLSLGYFNPDYEIKVCELKPGDSTEVSGLTVKAVEADHTIPCSGASACRKIFQGSSKRTGDTRRTSLWQTSEWKEHNVKWSNYRIFYGYGSPETGKETGILRRYATD